MLEFNVQQEKLGNQYDKSEIETVAILPVRNVVVYPHMAAALVADRSGSIKILEEAFQQDKMVMILLQSDPENDHPAPDDLHK